MLLGIQVVLCWKGADAGEQGEIGAKAKSLDSARAIAVPGRKG